jgi:hypothetical protein
MKMTKAIKKDLELLNDPNLPDFEREILNRIKRLVTGESAGIPHEEMKKIIREMLEKNRHSENEKS